MRSQDFAECFMVGVGQVYRTVLLAIERQEKDMREAFVETLGTVVGPPFVPRDFRYFGRQGAERLPNLADIVLRGTILELEHYYMA